MKWKWFRMTAARRFFAIFGMTAALFISGCVNYFGIPGPCSRLANFCGMNTDPSCCFINTCWWEIFCDPQLNCLIKLGLANSPTIKVAQARVRLAESISDVSTTKLFPNILARGYFDREHFSKNWLIPPPIAGETLNQPYVGLKFEYEFDFWGQHRSALNAALSEQQAACADLYSARLVLATSIANTYFELRSNEIQRDIAKSMLKQRQTMLEIAEKRAAAGVQSSIPTNSAGVNVSAAQANLQNLQQATELTNHQLSALLGRPPCEPVILSDCSHYNPPIFEMPKCIPLDLIARRPDIMALRWQVESAGYKISEAKARFYPNIDLFALAGFLSIGYGNFLKASSQEDSLCPAFHLPIFDAGELRANLRGKYASYDVAVEQYNDAIVSAVRDVADQLTTLKSTAALQRVQHASLKAKKRNYDLSYLQYESGIVDYLNTLQMDDMVLEQRMVEIQAKTRYLQAIVATIKSLGGGYQGDDCGTF